MADPRLIGGVYRTGQVITAGDILTSYTAYNRNTNDVVGLFVLALPDAVDTPSAQRLLRPLEQRRLVESPHVIRVYDWGVDGRRIYIATDAPRGLTLRQVLDNETIDLKRALDFVRQIARGLIALHNQGIAGIDMRPQLVTVDSTDSGDRIQLDDVGLRSLLNGLGYATGEHLDDISYLDPRYAAPEYLQGGQIGPASDIYQEGLLIFELVTGRLPFVGRDPAETAVLQCTAPPPRMAQFKYDAPPSLQQIVDYALAKNSYERFPNAAALLHALDTLQLSAHPSWSTADVPTTPPSLLKQSTNQMIALEDDPTLLATSTAATSTSGDLAPQPAPETSQVPNEEGVYAYLIYEKDGQEKQQFAMQAPDVIVGRTDPKRGSRPDIDLTALDPNMTVSRQHARLRYAEPSFTLEDLKSHNKTRLRGLPLAPLKPEQLQHGDVVQFGAVRLVFKVPRINDVASKAHENAPGTEP